MRYRAVNGIQMFFFIKVKTLLTRVVNVMNNLKARDKYILELIE